MGEMGSEGDDAGVCNDDVGTDLASWGAGGGDGWKWEQMRCLLRWSPTFFIPLLSAQHSSHVLLDCSNSESL